MNRRSNVNDLLGHRSVVWGELISVFPCLVCIHVNFKVHVLFAMKVYIDFVSLAVDQITAINGQPPGVGIVCDNKVCRLHFSASLHNRFSCLRHTQTWRAESVPGNILCAWDFFKYGIQWCDSSQRSPYGCYGVWGRRGPHYEKLLPVLKGWNQASGC